MTGGVENGGREGAVPAWPSCGKQEKEAIDPKAVLLMRHVENQSQEEVLMWGLSWGLTCPSPTLTGLKWRKPTQGGCLLNVPGDTPEALRTFPI